MRDPRLPEAKRARGGGRDVDDPPANEWPAVDDPDDRAPAVVEIEHLHPGSKRESFVSRNQPAVMWILVIGSYTRFTSRHHLRKTNQSHTRNDDSPHPMHLFVPTLTSLVWMVD